MTETPNMIMLSDDEAALAREAALAVAQAEQQLGRLRAAFLFDETAQMNRLMEKSDEYEKLQAMLLRKNCKGPGQFQLVPEIGAFVEVPSLSEVRKVAVGDSAQPSQSPSVSEQDHPKETNK